MERLASDNERLLNELVETLETLAVSLENLGLCYLGRIPESDVEGVSLVTERILNPEECDTPHLVGKLLAVDFFAGACRLEALHGLAFDLAIATFLQEVAHSETFHVKYGTEVIIQVLQRAKSLPPLPRASLAYFLQKVSASPGDLLIEKLVALIISKTRHYLSRRDREAIRAAFSIGGQTIYACQVLEDLVPGDFV